MLCFVFFFTIIIIFFFSDLVLVMKAMFIESYVVLRYVMYLGLFVCLFVLFVYL